MNTAVAGQAQNIGFAVSAATLTERIEAIRDGGGDEGGSAPTGDRAYLGVTLEDAEDGALVTGVGATSPAADVGLEPGDVITGVGDDAVTSVDDLVSAIADRESGDEVELTWERDGDEQSARVTLGER
jgi:putative serine protease PepD